MDPSSPTRISLTYPDPPQEEPLDLTTKPKPPEEEPLDLTKRKKSPVKKRKLWRPWESPPKRLKPSDVPGEPPDVPGPSTEQPPEEEDPPNRIPYQIPGFDPSDFYRRVDLPPQTFRNRMTKQSFRIRLMGELPGGEEVQDKLPYLLAIGAHALQPFLDNCDPEDSGVISASNPGFSQDVYTNRKLACSLDFADVVERIAAILQSDDSIVLEETVFSVVSWTRRTVGTGSEGIRRRTEPDLLKAVHQKRFSIDPQAERNNRSPDMKEMCLPLSILVGVKFYELGCQFHKKGQGSMRLRQLSQTIRIDKFETETKELVEKAGFGDFKGPFTLDQMASFQTALGPTYQICIWDSTSGPIHTFGSPKADHIINLFVIQLADSKHHAVFIRSMPAFLGKDNFCQVCKQSFDRSHKCPAAGCHICMDPKCSNTQEPDQLQQCPTCNETYRTDQCFEAHKLERCAKWKRCLLCWELCRINDFPKHPCGKPPCKHCKHRHSPLEPCFVQPQKPKDPEEQPRILYGDIETFVDKKGDHTANLIIIKDEEAQDFCPPFKGPGAAKELVDQMVRKDSPFKDSRIFFHNGGRFDVHLIYKELVNIKMPPKFIARGQTILNMETAQNNISFRDTLQFMPGMPLSDFPTNFKLKSGPKGLFPHGLNGTEWVDFENPDKPYLEDGKRFPLKKYFDPENMRPKQKKKFEEWYESEAAKYKDA